MLFPEMLESQRWCSVLERGSKYDKMDSSVDACPSEKYKWWSGRMGRLPYSISVDQNQNSRRNVVQVAKLMKGNMDNKGKSNLGTQILPQNCAFKYAESLIVQRKLYQSQPTIAYQVKILSQASNIILCEFRHFTGLKRSCYIS